ncbi:hypothetical protein [Agrobacterium burrii]
MSIVPPRIGMDRFVDAEWMKLAASVVRGESDWKDLQAQLAADIPGPQVQRKAIGILNRMWFPEDTVGRSLTIQAAMLVQHSKPGSRAAAFVAVAIGAYPYFREVVENVGRLLRLQETCSAGEVHRRMFELHGKRATIDQATSYAFKTMVSWGMVQRQADRRLCHAAPLELIPEAKKLLDLAANRSRHSVTPLQATDPMLFAFNKG